MKRGDTVTQVLPAPFVGKVTGFQIDQEGGKRLVHVVAEDGTARYFEDDDIQVTEVAQEPDAPETPNEG